MSGMRGSTSSRSARRLIWASIAATGLTSSVIDVCAAAGAAQHKAARKARIPSRMHSLVAAEQGVFKSVATLARGRAFAT
jgi:hypothetical protein